MRGSDLLQKTSRAMSSRFKINLVSSGTQAFTDGKTINVPALPENISQKDWEVVCGYSEHEVAHIRFSDFDIFKEVESDTLKNLLNLIEDVRIEKKHASEFLGVKILLEKTVNHVWEKFYVKDQPLSSIEINPFSMMIFEARRQCVGMGLKEIPSFYDDCVTYFGSDIFDKINKLTSTQDSLKLAREILKKLEEEHEKEEKRKEEKSKSKDGDAGDFKISDDGSVSGESDEKSDDGDGDDKSKEKSESGDGLEKKDDKGESSDSGDSAESEEDDGSLDDPDAEHEKFDDVESSGGTGSKEDSKESSGESKSSLGLNAETTGSSENPSEAESAVSMPSGSTEEGADKTTRPEEIIRAIEDYIDIYKEIANELVAISKDSAATGQYVVLSKKHDRIVKMEDYTKELGYVKDWLSIFNELKSELGSIVSAKHKISSLFLTRVMSRWIGDKDNGKINPRALNKLKTGYTSVFREKTKHDDMDTAVTFLVDFSGSMGGSRIREAMRSVILFLEVLTASKIKCEVLGYTTCDWSAAVKKEIKKARETSIIFGRVDPLLTYIIKEFDEPYDTKIKKRIGMYNHVDLMENCDGDSLVIAHDRLLARKEKRKILFVLSDGAVANAGSRSAGRRYLKEVASNIEKAGLIELIGVGFFSSSVTEYYKNNFVITGGGTSLTEKMCVELKKIFKV